MAHYCRCCVILLLATFISQCGATEYYVRPTDPTNASCPGQPCLTLNQYITNSSYYILANVMFNFLPGNHDIARPLDIRNVHNVTLKGISDGSDEYPQLVAQFSCWSNYQCSDQREREKIFLNDLPLEACSVIQLTNVSHVNISDIRLALSTVNISAVRVEKSRYIYLKLDIYSAKTGLDTDGCNIGIMANETIHFLVEKLHASKLLYGLILQYTQNAHVKESMIEDSGLLVVKSDTVHITSTNSSGNREAGMVYLSSQSTDLVNVSSTNHNGSGVLFQSCRNIKLTNISVTNNQNPGIGLLSCNSTSISNVSASNNQFGAIYLRSCSDTSISDVFAIKNLDGGMAMYSCTNTSIMNTPINNNEGVGLVIESCNETKIANVSLNNNQNIGMVLISCSGTSISNVSAINNPHCGIYMFLCINTDMIDTSVTSNQGYGLYIESCYRTSITNTSASNNQGYGIALLLCRNTSIINVSTANHLKKGMYIQICHETKIADVSTTKNQGSGMGLLLCKNTSITNVLATNNQKDGIVLSSCNNTNITNVSATKNQWIGIHLESCSNTSIANVYATKNEEPGLLLLSCNNTNITNVSAINNNLHSGMTMFSCRSTNILNVSVTNNQGVGLYIESSNETNITNVSAINNQHGMGLFFCKRATIIHSSVTNNQVVGLYTESSNETNITNVFAVNNQYGLGLHLCGNTTIMDTIATKNQNMGMYIQYSSETKFTNLSATQNQFSGMMMSSCNDINITNVLVTNNQHNGIILSSCNNANLTNVSATKNQQFGTYIDFNNISAIQNQFGGTIFSFCRNTNVTSVLTIGPQHNTIMLSSCNKTNINVSDPNIHQFGMYIDFNSITAFDNGFWFGGLVLFSCRNTNLRNILANNNQHGLRLSSCSNTNVTNVSAANNQQYGFYVKLCNSEMNINNIYVTQNQLGGTIFSSCRHINLTDILAINNRRDGIKLSSCSNTNIYNVSAINNQWKGMDLDSCRNVSIINVNTSKNNHGGLHLVLCKDIILAFAYAAGNENDGIMIISTSSIVMRNVSVNKNEYAGIFLLSHSHLQLDDSVFSDVVPLSSTSVATGLHTEPVIIRTIDSTILVRNCNFTRNNITSIRAVASNITVQGDVTFADNQALVGTALHFSQSSVLVISETSTVLFENNYAINYGGTVNIDTEEVYGEIESLQDIITLGIETLVTTRTRCFIEVEGDRAQARLIFVNNTAGRGGDVVYGGLVALGYDGDWNCLQSFKNVSDMSQQNDFSVISSVPSRVCLCQNDHFKHPDDCLTVADPHTYSIYPGQTITLPAVVVGQDFGTVTGPVIAQFLPKPYTTCVIDMASGQQSTSVDKSMCTTLNYTLYTRGESCTAILVLKTDNAKVLQPMTIEDNHKVNRSWKILNENPNYHELAFLLLSEFIAEHNVNPFSNYSEVSLHTIKDFLKFTLGNSIICMFSKCLAQNASKFVFPKEIYGYPTFINISFNSCPLGFSLSTNPPYKCDCNHLLQQMPRVECDINKLTITRDGLVWIGTYGNETVAATKYCPYNYCKSTKSSLTLQESDSEHSNRSSTDTQCNHRHSGILCGGCKPGLSLALGSDRCLHCSNVYISLLLPFIMAGVVLVFLIKFLNLTISQGTMNALIFYANVVSINKHLYYNSTSINPTTLFIAWFNLDVGIETCFFNGLTAYIRTWLQFVFPLYIWTIAGLIIILAKYNDRVARVMGNNGVPVLATLFLLSYAKLFNTIIRALSFTTLQTAQGQHLVWSVDGNIVYLGPEHAPLFAVAVIVLVFLWLPYTLLLLLGQWLHRLDYYLITRLLLKLKPFLDAHYAPFKDRHRYWFGLLLLARVATLLISAVIPQNTARIIEFSTALLCMVLTFWGQNVYRNSFVGNFATTSFLNLAVINVTVLFSSNNISVATFTLIAITLAQFAGLVLYKVIAIVKHSPKVKICRVGQREAEDEWELYEQVAFQREVESDSEEDRESNKSGSNDSLPTYGV